MKTALIALLAFVAATATAQDSCQNCQDGVANLGAYLLTPPELRKVEAILKAEVCPLVGADNQAGCESAIDTWWAKIAESIFKYPNTVPAICGGLGLCARRSFFKQELDCDQCKDSLTKVGALIGSDAFASQVAEDLNGDMFCGNADYVDASNSAVCTEYMSLVAEPAVKTLGGALQAAAVDICTDNGFC